MTETIEKHSPEQEAEDQEDIKPLLGDKEKGCEDELKD